MFPKTPTLSRLRVVVWAKCDENCWASNDFKILSVSIYCHYDGHQRSQHLAVLLMLLRTVLIVDIHCELKGISKPIDTTLHCNLTYSSATPANNAGDRSVKVGHEISPSTCIYQLAEMWGDLSRSFEIRNQLRTVSWNISAVVHEFLQVSARMKHFWSHQRKKVRFTFGVVIFRTVILHNNNSSNKIASTLWVKKNKTPNSCP